MIKIISDLHFGMRKSSMMFHKILMEKMDWFTSHVNKEDTVVILGDLFDSRSSIDFMILNESIESLKRLARKCKKVYALVGNHDLYFKENKKEDVNFRLMESRNFEVIQALSEIMIEDKYCLFIPWIDNDKSKQKAIDVMNSEEHDIVFGHFEDGSLYDNNVSIEHEMPTDLFAKQKMVLSGHYHKRLKKNNVNFVGSFISQTFNDIGNVKGYHKIEDGELIFVDNNCPMFDYVDVKSPFEFITNFEKNKPELSKRVEGNIIKIILSEYSVDNSKIIELIKTLNPLNLTIMFSKVDMNVDAGKANFNGFDRMTNIVSVISDYIDTVDSIPEMRNEQISINIIKDIIKNKYENYSALTV